MSITHTHKHPWRYFLAAFALAMSTITVSAGETQELELSSGWLRATPPGARNAAAFLSVKNTGAANRSIIEVQCPTLAARCELHEHVHSSDGKMRMQKITQPLVIPARGVLTLAPGGYHIMLFDLLAPLRAGAQATLTLQLDDHSTLTAILPIKAISDE
ncbi:MAG: copper chaperone PCu(A)C [Pseudomonadales bacterium]|nr:copper chaperone PCu(A)C [Pseudomonadales bacterium]